MLTNGQFSQQVVGVLAPRFQLYFPAAANIEPAPEVWIANRLGYDNANRNGVSIRAVGRLRDGVSSGRVNTKGKHFCVV
jgi:putative ABC transport system permease protein